MRKRRVAAAWGTWLVVAGMIAATVAHALYYQSNLYRRGLEADLASFFGLPTEIGSISPHSFTARQLGDVRVWLPEKRDLVFRCPRVIWDKSGAPGGREASIDIHEPVWLLGSEAWRSHDYTRLLQAGLKHNFQAVKLGIVRLHGARLEWQWPGCKLHADGVDGKLVFDAQGRGQADLVCHQFNGHTTSAPIHISARIDPEADDLLPEVVLVVPELPMTSLGLDQILQSPVTQGSFCGTITLMQSRGGDRIVLSGRAEKVRLDEWTKRMPGGAISGLLDLTIERLMVQDRQLRELRFRGEAAEIAADPLLARFGWPQLGGIARLRVLDGRVADGVVRNLHVSGSWDGGSLDGLCQRLFGKTGLEGRLRARINSLVIENERIAGGDIELSGEPPPGQPGTIKKALLTEAFEKVFGLWLPSQLLPDRVQYTQMGVRILIDHEEVRVLSGLGPAGPALITARILGQDLPLGGQLDLHLSVDQLLDQVKGQLDLLPSDLRRRLLTATRPT